MSTSKRATLARWALAFVIAPLALTVVAGPARADWRHHQRWEHREHWRPGRGGYYASSPPPVYYAPPSPPPGITLSFPIR